jgi:ATP-dependent Clp protease ATP-binding subunit ClpC
MDEGRLTDGRGQKVSFRDAIIIMTSNLGVKEVQQVQKTIGFGEASVLTDEKRSKAAKDALKKEFKPEFLNRISCIVNFGSLTKDDYLRIIELELEKLKTYLKLNKTEYSKLKLKFDKSLYEHIYSVGIDKKYGARPLQRAIEHHVSTPLARKLLKESIKVDGTLIIISAKKGEVVFTLKKSNKKKVAEEKANNPPFYMESGSSETF